MANARQEIDVREQINLIGSTYFISTLIAPNLDKLSCKINSRNAP